MVTQAKYDRQDIRRLNAVSVLNQLRLNGPMSRANIAASLGLTRATVSNIVADFIAASLINETQFAEGGTGRPGLLLNLNANCGCMIAVEIDLDRISLLLANVGQECIWRKDLALSAGASAEETLGLASGLVRDAIAHGKEKNLRCMGVCVAWAGLVRHEDGQLAYGPTSGWEHVPLKKDWTERFGVPVYVENEANAGAIGAFHFGEAQGVRNMIYLSLGVGLAAGIFANGALLRGKQGYAGQVGHTFFSDNTIECSCGKRGCWVTEVGASALLRKLTDAGFEIPQAEGAGVDWLDFVVDSVRSGDETSLKVLQGVGRDVGRGLARLAQTFNSSKLIVGGRMAKLMRLVDSSVRESLLAETLPYMADPLELIVSDSEEDQLRGCLATVYDAIMKNPNSVP